MSLNLPLVAWGTIEDISGAGWSSIGSPLVTPGQADPFGGTGAALIDTNGLTGCGRSRTYIASTSGSTWVGLWLRQGTATINDMRFRDNTASVELTRWRVTWSGGIPSVSILVGSGSFVGPIAVGGGWYLMLGRADSVIAGNTMVITLYGERIAGATVGTTYYYWQTAVLLDFPDTPKAWSENRAGSGRIRSPSGNYDSWIVGTDHRFSCDLPWIPTTARSTPVAVSGWNGYAEIPCVNQGVSAMLTAGRNASALRWVPDRSACTTYIDSELVTPFDPTPPDLQPDGTRKVTGFALRNTATSYPLYL